MILGRGRQMSLSFCIKKLELIRYRNELEEVQCLERAKNQNKTGTDVYGKNPVPEMYKKTCIDDYKQLDKNKL